MVSRFNYCSPSTQQLKQIHNLQSTNIVQERYNLRLRVQNQAQSVEKQYQTGKRKQINVDLGDRTYPIYIGNNLLKDKNIFGQHIKSKSKVLVVTNQTISILYLQSCIKSLEDEGYQAFSCVLQDGEQFKSLQELNKIFDVALQNKFGRQATFIALGGGVVGDMTGFAAASYQRGINFIQIPTTVMSQVDSSVGGKTGVNHALGKNMIGAFHQPEEVIIDIQTLQSLPVREYNSGISEIIKYGLIRDAQLFDWLDENMEKLIEKQEDAVIHAIERSCINKAEIVALDEKEDGVRAHLNLGHTFGHAVETFTGYGSWLHGEAVGLGILMATDISYRLGYIDSMICERTLNLLQRAQLPLTVPQGMQPANFLELMAVDKKVQDGKIRLVLLKGELGNCIVTSDFDQSKLLETLELFCSNS